jgi:aerobic carbon-monoxide dehydrogenase medium subunit
MVLRGPGGERTLAMDEFHVGPFTTAVGEGEMLVEVRIPLPAHAGSAQEKVKRRAGDWAIAAAAVMLVVDGPAISDAGIALTAVGVSEPRSRWAEEALRGQPPSEEAFAEAGRRAAKDCDPIADNRGSAEYKRHLAGELTIRALRRAAERALAEEV